MVYDSEIGKVVLFGGTSGDFETWGDTWVLDTVNGEWSIAAEPTSAEGEDDEPSQTGIPGFPNASIIMGLIAVIIILWRARKF